MKRLAGRPLLIVGTLLLIVNIVWTWENATSDKDNGSEQAQRYPLLSRRIFVENPNNILINFVPLRKKLESRLTTVNAPKSFYFEYLPDGTSIRLGEDTELIAASLIKLPLVMNLYRAAEMDKVNLDKVVEITQNELDDGFGELWRQGPGTTISLRHAAELALRESDNTAMHVVYDAVVSDRLLEQDDESLARLDIDYSLRDGNAVISAKTYASILKCLYFACYLSPDSSQQLLDFMTHSSFNNRITKPLPNDIKVAHKIGVFSNKLSESDCGIFYVPKRPYLLCIMVGLPEEEADALMAELSKDIYDFVSGYKL